MSTLAELREIMGSEGLTALIFMSLFIGSALTGSAVYLVVDSWRRVQELREESDLKRDLLARGLSVDDVVRLLQASRDGDGQPPAAARGWAGMWPHHWHAWGWGCGHKRRKC